MTFAGPADAEKQAPIVLAAATQGIGQGKYDKIVNDCRFGGTDNDNSIGVGLIAIGQYAKNPEEYQKFKVIKIEVLKKPKHAELKFSNTATSDGNIVPSLPRYDMASTDNYLGRDLAEFAVELSNGKRVLLRSR